MEELPYTNYNFVPAPAPVCPKEEARRKIRELLIELSIGELLQLQAELEDRLDEKQNFHGVIKK